MHIKAVIDRCLRCSTHCQVITELIINATASPYQSSGSRHHQHHLHRQHGQHHAPDTVPINHLVHPSAILLENICKQSSSVLKGKAFLRAIQYPAVYVQSLHKLLANIKRASSAFARCTLLPFVCRVSTSSSPACLKAKG